MAQAGENAFIPQSPHSSPGGADSYRYEGTPDTRLTAFSPDENSARSTKFPKPLGVRGSEPQPYPVSATYTNDYSHTTQAEKDPFTSITTPGAHEQKLSATASAFQPFSVPLVVRGSSGTIPPLNGPSSSNGPSFSNGPSSSDGLRNLQSTIKRFSADLGLSRYLIITSTIQPISPADVEMFLMDLGHRGFIYHGKRQVHVHAGNVHVQFTDIRDASMVRDNAHTGGVGWQASYIQPEKCHAVNPRFPADAANEGLVFLEGLVGLSLVQGQTHIGASLYNLLQAEAAIFAFIPQEVSPSSPIYRALVEFCDVDASVAIVNRFNNFTADGIQLSLALYKQHTTPSNSDGPGGLPVFPSTSPLQKVSALFQGMALANTPQASRGFVATGCSSPSPLGHHGQPQLPLYPVVYQQSPYTTGTHYVVDPVPTRHTSMMPLNNHLPAVGQLYHNPSSHTGPVPMQGDFLGAKPLQNFNRFDGRRNATRFSRSPYYNGAGHHNHVDVTRIREGTDVRTTIMLRNIPNKVDQAMLKRIVDESSWGKYDFMYLRIDFANDCNVGYAFINFVDPLDIIDFVNARGNQRWNCFRSDKIAEISYATIQGKDCLVQKFRNSSVMLEAPHYRPKLYFTSNGPVPEIAGKEEQFPGPDNQSKMKRSCENAEHVGLFTPNAGQHFRDEQRRRRSQYDRGTRLAALEEFDYDTSAQNLYAAQ